MGIDLNRGFVAFPRGLTDWEWYTEPNTARLYFHLLLTANWQEKKWQGIMIHPGELVTSRSHLAKQLRMSEQSVRTALEHLQSTSYITIKTGPKYSIISLKNYSEITGINQLSNQLPTSNQPAANHNLTIKTINTMNTSSSALAQTPQTRTTSPIVMEFESSIGRLNEKGREELTAYTARLGGDLVSAVIAKCADLGARSWAYVRKALDEAEAQGCRSAEEYRLTNPIGGIRAKGAYISRQPEEAASSPDWLQNASWNRRSLKKKKKEVHDVPEP